MTTKTTWTDLIEYRLVQKYSDGFMYLIGDGRDKVVIVDLSQTGGCGIGDPILTEVDIGGGLNDKFHGAAVYYPPGDQILYLGGYDSTQLDTIFESNRC